MPSEKSAFTTSSVCMLLIFSMIYFNSTNPSISRADQLSKNDRVISPDRHGRYKKMFSKTADNAIRYSDGFISTSISTPDDVPDQVIFKIAEGSNQPHNWAMQEQQTMQRLNQAHGLHQTSRIFSKHTQGPLNKIYRTRLLPGKSALEVSNELKSDPDIEWAEPNYYRYTKTTLPNDPYYYSQMHLSTINAPQAWDITIGNHEVVIAIIDTGVDWDHPDLEANIWHNSDEIPGDGIDNDNNGFIDDIRGWDFVNADLEKVYQGEDPGPPDNNPKDFHGHGTHVAGIAGATGNNGLGVTGVCWDCTIMPVRAGYKNKYAQGVLQISDIAAALAYAADNGADIINMSFGSSYLSSTERIAIDYAASKGCILIAAAGNKNEGKPHYPSSFHNVLAVASTEETSGTKSYFSNYGLWIDVAAPGSSIYSTYVDDTYQSMSGTSMASPVVAGLAALIKSAHPSWSNQQIINQIIAGADDIDSENPYRVHRYQTETGQYTNKRHRRG